ncbi:chromate transporter [Novosphingobium kunmingense]|uniref:Chromate transporter n=1 Tax=Novosphingobium kunmingense TaxID=1211806 RepID=A0A2N0HKR4_9SPHN|nr:chromate efflux transporter [Novosphingobium kunmingense]PKB19551.1 chromate transporter [Novosphingobium kunmingense]
MSSETTAIRPPAITLGALFLKFLRFGALAFGGPVAQIAMLRQALVEDERWLDKARFNRLLAVLQVLPGPEAHELCVHLGMLARGRIGGVLAGLGFMLPGFVLMLAAGWLYTEWVVERDGWADALLGLQIAVLAIILRAVVRIGQHVIEDAWLWAIALASCAAILAGAAFWIPLAGGGLAYALRGRRWAAALILGGAALSAWLLAGTGSAAVTTELGAVDTAALFLAGLKGGLLTFGGAYTAIPYVRADTVGRGWIGDSTFLDGVAIAGVLPAPLVIFATFAGYVIGGFYGALAITAGMFLPAFAFSLVLFERLEALIEKPALHDLLTGLAAAVVGIIGATFLQLTVAASGRVASPVLALLLFVLSLAGAWRLKGSWVTPALLGLGALAGAILPL